MYGKAEYHEVEAAAFVAEVEAQIEAMDPETRDVLAKRFKPAAVQALPNAFARRVEALAQADRAAMRVGASVGGDMLRGLFG